MNHATSMVQGVGEQRRQAETLDGRGRKSRDEFAADAMPRVAAGFEDRDRHAGPAQGETKRQPRESAADDFDWFQLTHESVRRTAIMR